MNKLNVLIIQITLFIQLLLSIRSFNSSKEDLEKINKSENKYVNNKLKYLKEEKTIRGEFSDKKEFLKDKIMAHRGLFGYLPEHTNKGFELAYFMGAHFMETDIGLTKDGKMIVFHDPVLDHATNIKDFPEFENRMTNKTIDGHKYTNNYFITDFTYEEILKLNTKQRHKNRPQIYNKEFKILLIEDVLNMVMEFNKKYNKTTGVYIEPKNNILYHQELNMDINVELLKVLKANNLTNFYDNQFEKCPIVIQSFHKTTLEFFREKADLPHIYLMGWDRFYDIKNSLPFADGLGPNIAFLLYERIDDFLIANGTLYNSTEEFYENVVKKSFKESVEDLGKAIRPKKNNFFVDYAHSLDLIVAPYDLNNDSPRFDYNIQYEFCKMKRLKVDSFFADFCDTALFSTKNSEKLCDLIDFSHK